MFKKLFCFSFVSLLFLFFSSSVFAWNNMCYSPVQMAALTSKPKNKRPSTRKLRRHITGLEKKIDKNNDAIDDLEISLRDFLDASKLGEDPETVASQIREYIESQQDEWDCDSSTGQSFLFQFPKIFETLGYLLIPSAYADATFLTEEEETFTDIPGVNQTLCKNTKGTWMTYENGETICICPQGKKLEGNRCVATTYVGIECSEGEVFNENRECVTKCPTGQELKGNKCVLSTAGNGKKGLREN